MPDAQDNIHPCQQALDERPVTHPGPGVHGGGDRVQDVAGGRVPIGLGHHFQRERNMPQAHAPFDVEGLHACRFS